MRAEHMAVRLLTGAGSASLTAFRLEGQPVIESFAHGITHNGQLVVVAGGLERSDLPNDEPLDVRVDINLDAPELDIRLVAATSHMLGRLNWVTEHRRDDDVFLDQLPEHVAKLAALPHARLGVIDTESLLIHEAAGVTRIATDLIIERAITQAKPWKGNTDLVGLTMGLDRDELSLLVDSVVGGYRKGYVLSEKPAPAACPRVLGRTFVVDVVADGLTLMHVGETKTAVVHALFSSEFSENEQVTTAGFCQADLVRLLSV